MQSRQRPTVVVLAAGQGSRFMAAAGGSVHKLEQTLGASTVLGRTLEHVIATGCPFVVVTTARLVLSAARLVARRDVVVVSDEEARRGVGHSIAAGVSERADASGWLILPGDMPLIAPQSIVAVADALADHAVAHTQYRGRRGHPVGFGSELFSELAALDGDEGARRVVARYPAHPVVVDDPGVLVDIDTPGDLARARHAADAAPAASRIGTA
jgi:molybdenum cofactor cytidylyltransferase